MLDTVRFNLNAQLRCQQPPPEWKALGVRARTSSNRGYLSSCGTSLPRLMWGHNGRLIATQQELDSALEKLHSLVADVAVVPPIGEWKPTRLDLVYQIELPDAAAVIDVLSGFRIPDVRSPPIHQAGHCVTWRGAGSKFLLQAYHKSRKMHQPGEVLRIEVRMASGQLRRLRGRSWLRFPDLYSTYREVLEQLPCIPLTSNQGGWQEAVAVCVPCEYHEAILAAVSAAPRTRRFHRERLKLATFHMPKPFSLISYFPTDEPPRAATVEARPSRSAPRPRTAVAPPRAAQSPGECRPLLALANSIP